MSAVPSPSRTASDYRPDPRGHFHRRKNERKVPGPEIARCFETGEPEKLEAGRVAFVSDRATVVVNTRKMTAETVYWGSP